jgi:hypothetical protein
LHCAPCADYARQCAFAASRSPITIGWRARNQWLALDAAARQGHTYIEAFKLALQDTARAANLPPWLSAEQVPNELPAIVNWQCKFAAALLKPDTAVAAMSRAHGVSLMLLLMQAVGDYLSLLRAYAMEVFDDKYSADPSPPTEDTILW